MITEDYVSFEIAKLLKEKGFDEGCRLHYHYDEAFDKYFPTDESISGFEQYYYPCPTLQMVMKWLREEQNLFIEIQCYGCEANKKAHFEYSYVISEFVKTDNKICTVVGLEEKKAKSRFSSYEEACEEAIKYCLEKLI